MNIDNVLARAQRMMLDENWNAQVEMGAAAQRAGSINGKGNSGANDLAALEAQAFGASAPSVSVNYTPIPEEAKRQRSHAMITDNGKPIQMLQETRQQINTKTSNLPKSVLESFAAQPPLSGDNDFDTPPASYYGNTPMPAQPTQVMTEQYVPQPQVSAGIDYNALKYIINECIKENMKSLNESNINNFKGMRIANGSVIQFIDNKGNLYEGKLTLKKKANQ